LNTETDPAPPKPTIVNNVVASQCPQLATTLGMGGLFSPPPQSYAATANDAGNPYPATANEGSTIYVATATFASLNQIVKRGRQFEP
jgi:hypothetical protein